MLLVILLCRRAHMLSGTADKVRSKYDLLPVILMAPPHSSSGLLLLSNESGRRL